MNISHRGRNAIVTGAAGGLGIAIVHALSESGARVAMVDSKESVFATATNLDSSGERISAFQGDVTSPDDVQRIVRSVNDLWGSTHILVNNAGIAPKHGGIKPAFEAVERSEWQSVMAVNLEGPFLFCQAVLPRMRSAEWGRIINISSGAGRTASPTAGAAYGTSKAGLIGLTRILATEVASQHITVNSIAPGRINTAPIRIFGSEANEVYRQMIPVGRFGEPEEVAAAVVFLSSSQASYITGATLDVNGGRFMG